MADDENIDAEDVIRVMIATDSHLGYAEKDQIRGEDSFTAFEEMLNLAVSEDVDFILLGGDLFHDAVPSQNAMYKCMQLLRRYTFGDKPIPLEILSEQSFNFHNAVNQSVNYEDPNLNISIPVFSIHGNHDDPTGYGRLSSLDLLSTTGMVNYFGRSMDLTKIEINPILLRKGKSYLALYGLSHINDARLSRLFENYKVTIARPSEEEGDWFHLMVLHQNRADRGVKNYLPEEALPPFLHLVIWGHEHDCRIEPEHNLKRDFFVSQPGSSVATSLAEGEAIKKHVGLLEIYKNKFHLKPLPLQTVRPFIFESVNLKDYIEELRLEEGDAANKVKDFADGRIESMIYRAKELHNEHPKQPKLPLIRLRLLFEKEEYMFNTIRFGHNFNNRVANPTDVVVFKKIIKKTKHEAVDFDQDAMKRATEGTTGEDTNRVEEMVERYFDEAKNKNPLKLLPSKALSEMTYRMVHRSDVNAAENILKIYREKAMAHLMNTLPDEDEVDDQLMVFKEQFKVVDMLKLLDELSGEVVVSTTTSSTSIHTSTSTNASVSASTSTSASAFAFTKGTTSTRGRGRGRGRGTTYRSASSRSTTAGTHIMPQLDVTVNTFTRSSDHQQTLLHSVTSSRSKKKPVYVISSDSEPE